LRIWGYVISCSEITCECDCSLCGISTVLDEGVLLRCRNALSDCIESGTPIESAHNMIIDEIRSLGYGSGLLWIELLPIFSNSPSYNRILVALTILRNGSHRVDSPSDAGSSQLTSHTHRTK
jgi:hypothetical protein